MEMLAELNNILKNGNITSVFQPIVSLKDASVLGYEALSRGPKGSSLEFPDKLFKLAAIHNKSWELESLCRVKALENAKSIHKDKLLFINVDPLIFKDEKFKKGFTKEFLLKHNISPESIIFEITEKTAIEDYKSFSMALNNYTEQGYQIAIDDTGSGYSGLKTLYETKPHYIKIDMDLIRDIDKDYFKQALIKSLVMFAKSTNMKVIAEGIETEEELSTLINLNVHAGQGYYINKPSTSFSSASENAISTILKYNKLKNDKYSYFNHCIGQICSFEPSFAPEETCQKIKDFVNKSPTKGACIVKNNKPVGSVMKYSLDSVMASQYGFSVFSKRPISLIMDHSPLVVDYHTPVSEVSKIAMEREHNKVYDCVIVVKESEYYGLVTIKKLLEFTTEMERNYAKELNPLTGLPGNTIIEKVLNDVRKVNNHSCILYFDLDNFKAYNDVYGFEKGDKLLKFTSKLLQNNLKKKFPFNSFLGHIGGDDYIGIVENSLDKCEELCSYIINEFDKNVVKFFNRNDVLNGFIESTDRQGNRTTFNLTSLSIAGLYGNFNNFSSSEEISKLAAKIKKEAKAITGSSKVIKKI
ncbi:phytochrome-like protein cph2 [Clostridium homopropionicum DSM 5847]|uniref:Phytochrome-like protein cph2 n=1 Tax=Clostridium homopropionicum DSM 5847 TaxID=1121318 RepID=A0A0L6Z5P8_9CLOT|nr:GGDEF domain-containing protein [Clostridium homopropionicum]KOA18294.1 phytochrome-like protein cph2 [Clostridium homopropionicum DSM 5847]SFF69651.1 diguanylate cyclase/phosphodiesterase [Clostridium homopropionicum]